MFEDLHVPQLQIQPQTREPEQNLLAEMNERIRTDKILLKAGALQRAIFNSANFSSIATDAHGVIQIFNVGAERMLGYTAAEVVNKVTPADISDEKELIARAAALSLEFGTTIAPGFEALVFKASRGIEDIYELTYCRKDGSELPRRRLRHCPARCPGRHHRLSPHRHRQHRPQKSGRGPAAQ